MEFYPLFFYWNRFHDKRYHNRQYQQRQPEGIQGVLRPVLQDCGSDVDLDAKVDAEFETAGIDVVLKEIFKGKVTDRS